MGCTELQLLSGQAHLDLSYSYALHLFGHEPLASLHTLDLSAGLPLGGMFELAGDRADPVAYPLTGGQDANVVATYTTDYTLLAHGPHLSLTLQLPWRLRLSAHARTLWRSFNSPDALVPAAPVIGAAEQADMATATVAPATPPAAWPRPARGPRSSPPARRR